MMRYARYAAAVLFTLLAAGFVALWVRSYSHFEAIFWPLGHGYAISAESACGLTHTVLFSTTISQGHVSSTSGEVAKEVAGWRYGETLWGLGLKLSSHDGRMRLWLPYWFLTLSSLALAALFAVKRTWRFSLRTILVAATLLAGVLGLAV
jgi:hypothetical protein